MFVRLTGYSLVLVLFPLATTVVFGAEQSTPEGMARHAEKMTEGLELFKTRVRGILLNNCLECHGGDKVEGDLDMSTRQSLLASGVVSTDSPSRDLMAAVTHLVEPFMPHKRDSLPPEDIEALARWLDLGVPYGQPLSEKSVTGREGPLVVTGNDRNYWAYRTLERTEIPTVGNTLWPRTEIDFFIAAKLEERGLAPNDPADRHTLIRRVYLNAIGLPPSSGEVKQFVNDADTHAYEHMIDRLLDSPHYGERWARHWMDIARFAESSGFEIDFDRPYAYHYRDFLIKAFNQNMPYDQFIQWQVAGDELAPENPLALMATGFLGAGPFPSVLTEKEFKSSRYDQLDDMVNTLGTAMLGTTIGCARCHDHKYDPVTTRDYYELAAHFTRTVQTYVDYDPGIRTFDFIKSAWALDAQALAHRLADYEEMVLDASFREWLESGSYPLPLERWIVLSPDTFSSFQGSTLEKLWDDSILLTGLNPERETEVIFIEAETTLQNITGLRMETLTHPLLPNNGPGRDHEGGFTIQDISVFIQESGRPDAKWKAVELEAAEATSQENDLSLGAGAAINQVTQGWSIDLDAFGKDQALVIRFSRPVGFPSGSRIKITVSSGYNLQQMVARPRFSITQDPLAPVETSEGVPVLAYQALLKLLVGRSPQALTRGETQSLRQWYGRTNDGWIERRERWIEHQLARPKSSNTRIRVSADKGAPIWHRSARKGFPSFYETTHYLIRGDVDQKGEVAKPGFPRVLLREPDNQKHQTVSHPRSSLANWLTDVEGGAGSLLARVFVNRVWHHHFGKGIVATPSDFGTQGEIPSHPQLLEWLARDFVAHGWDIKRLQKQIMTSAVYRQSSLGDEMESSLDGENRLLWRFPVRRMEAEAIRDSLLKVSGLLDPALYGPGSRDPRMLRRSIYFFIKRGALIPEMVLFDWPEHLVGTGNRATTTSAPQALQFLNSPETRKYAETFAERLACGGEWDLDSMIRKAYLLAFSRPPRPGEIQWGIRFIEEQMASYQERGYDNQSAVIDYCQSLFSLNEFIYIR